MKYAKKCKKLKFKIILIYTCSKAKISRRIRFWIQNGAIFNRFLAKWNFSYFFVVFCIFLKKFQKIDLKQIFPEDLTLFRSHIQILVNMFFQKSCFLLSGRVIGASKKREKNFKKDGVSRWQCETVSMYSPIAHGHITRFNGLWGPWNDHVCTMSPQCAVSFIVAPMFHIRASYGPIELCFGYDALLGLCYHTFRAYDPILGP